MTVTSEYRHQQSTNHSNTRSIAAMILISQGVVIKSTVKDHRGRHKDFKTLVLINILLDVKIVVDFSDFIFFPLI